MLHLKQILQQAKLPYIKKIVVDHNITNNIYEISKQYGNNIFLVTDENIVELLNKNLLDRISHLIIPSLPVLSVRDTRIHNRFESASTWKISNKKDLVQDNSCIPSLKNVELIRNRTKDSDLIVALGSGTINDICKYASFLEKKDYICFPTAASMNGYISPNASILVDWNKKSFEAHPPKAVYIDIDIITFAPLRLTLSGFADFICRSTVQADWLLSYLLLNTEYNILPFKFVHELEEILLKEYLALIKRNRKVILLLMEALLISGFGMAISKGSYSASQGEHMIAHTMEMVTKDYYSSLHGEKIAITTLTMANLQEKILSAKNPIIRTTKLDKEYFNSYFSNTKFAKILKQKENLQQKAVDVFHKEWKNISCLIRQNLLPAKKLQRIFENLSIPHLPEHLGWNRRKYYKVVNLAFAVRNRFTFLDLIHYINNFNEVEFNS